MKGVLNLVQFEFAEKSNSANAMILVDASTGS